MSNYNVVLKQCIKVSSVKHTVSYMCPLISSQLHHLYSIHVGDSCLINFCIFCWVNGGL